MYPPKNKFFFLFLLLIFGIFLLWLAGTIPENIPADVYDFEFAIFFKNHSSPSFDKNPPFNRFLLSYDFSSKRGNLTFAANFDKEVDYFLMDFPKFVSNHSINVSITKCYISNVNCTQPVLDIIPQLSFVQNPVGFPRYTTLAVNNFSRPMEDERITISFALDMLPNGVFSFYHHNNRINYYMYSVNFILGEKYKCGNPCLVDLDRSVKEFYESDTLKGNIMLQFDSESPKQANRIKLISVPLNKVPFLATPLKDLLFGLGTSIIASSIVLTLTPNLNKAKLLLLRKRRKLKKKKLKRTK